MTTLHDSILGCIIGGAIGDYVGSPYEGRLVPREICIPKASRLSDDTQLTLATCEAIIRARGPDPEMIAGSFSEWYARGRITGVGSSTLKALRDLSVGTHWALAGAKGEMSAGNGAAMRIAPVAFCVDPFESKGRLCIRDIATITHRNDEAFAGALAIAVALNTVGFDFLPAVIAELYDSNTRDRIKTLLSCEGKTISELGVRFGATGYVAESVPIALLAASRAESLGFKDALFDVISCGGDTDTTGSMVGQIVGSKIGFSGIPEELRSLSFSPEPVEKVANYFADFVCRKKE